MAEFSDAKSGAYCMCTREKCSDECRTYRQFRPKTITNADRIRAMTDEELAEWMVYKVECQYCPIRSAGCAESEASCRTNWLDWLKEEAVSNG